MLFVAPFLLHVEVCVQSPEPPAVDPPPWHWRTIDGRKCYFRADKLLPREDLFWEDEGTTDAGEYDRRIGATVIDRKHYQPGDLRERVASPDESRPRRKKFRRRRRDDDDDD
jgi:hypothetical protein